MKTTNEMRSRIRDLTNTSGSDDYDKAVSMLLEDFEQLVRELSCRDALIKDHLATILRLENRIERQHAIS